MSRLPLLFLACWALSACSGEDPFVEQYPVDIRRTSSLSVCHDQDATRTQIDAKAAEACASIDKVAQFTSDTRFQCRLMSPHRARYKCVDKPKN